MLSFSANVAVYVLPPMRRQTVVSAELRRLCAQTAVLFRVELDSILRVGYHAVKVGNAVWNIRIGKAVGCHQRVERRTVIA